MLIIFRFWLEKSNCGQLCIVLKFEKYEHSEVGENYRYYLVKQFHIP